MLLEEIKQIQEELKKRTQVEKEAESLICQVKLLESIELLNTLDDNKISELLNN